ncbi:unnamed protein product [Bursaphelenchus okinawaensis]|uniref:Uncharacterized protein n=1 Tax=Bursaphelenchus okinawaensis TaxID=465554 RepID=A0A811L0A8_9BILA|nr:unnamed protein product [Bursaphelenchus okinawaensis]CAG9113881.1 unnamed protein product [Bursaphelenchus okinawaensis]
MNQPRYFSNFTQRTRKVASIIGHEIRNGKVYYDVMLYGGLVPTSAPIDHLMNCDKLLQEYYDKVIKSINDGQSVNTFKGSTTSPQRRCHTRSGALKNDKQIEIWIQNVNEYSATLKDYAFNLNVDGLQKLRAALVAATKQVDLNLRAIDGIGWDALNRCVNSTMMSNVHLDSTVDSEDQEHPQDINPALWRFFEKGKTKQGRVCVRCLYCSKIYTGPCIGTSGKNHAQRVHGIRTDDLDKLGFIDEVKKFGMDANFNFEAAWKRKSEAPENPPVAKKQRKSCLDVPESTLDDILECLRAAERETSESASTSSAPQAANLVNEAEDEDIQVEAAFVNDGNNQTEAFDKYFGDGVDEEDSFLLSNIEMDFGNDLLDKLQLKVEPSDTLPVECEVILH